MHFRVINVFMVCFLNNFIATSQPKAVLCIMALPTYEKN